jgi:uncharacterized DUF497 family protein
MFSWDAAKALRNHEKHGVTFEEAATVFGDEEAVEWEDLEQVGADRRWKRVGFSLLGRVLLVVYQPRRLKDGKETIRIISARQANRLERKAYSRQRD